MTVIELRKLAKEKHVRLGAGLSKDGIIQKLTAALAGESTEEATEQVVEETPAAAPEMEAKEPAAQEEETPAVQTAQQTSQEAPAREERTASAHFKAAWHNPSPRYSAKPAYQAPAYSSRPAWQARSASAPRTTANTDTVRMNTTRPTNYAPRFGPDAVDPAPAPSVQRGTEEYRSFREQPRNFGGFQENRSIYGERSWSEQQRSSFQEGGYVASSYGTNAPTGYGPRASYTSRRADTGYYNQELGTSNPAVPEMLAAGECGDGQGILEIHPDGYGFLRPENFLPSSKDIYVSMAQIRRFGLRTGDLVVGKTRPQREGDKYAAMLYITAVNGCVPDELGQRPAFEDLTPVYPSRRIDLESHNGKGSDAMRIADLIAPIGFGQRGLLLCPPDTGKTQILQDFANVITENYPQVTVLVLLIDECPEDVTLFREQVKCEVVASTFDQAPENHLRLADMVLERAQRLVEQKQDVVVVVDSLTRLAKAYTTTAAQQGRNMPGMVNPSSLFRAKKLFGTARCVKEGGSLTILGAMNVDNGSKVDDTVVEEFKGTANMELVLDQEVAKAGVSPAINLKKSGTKRADLLMTPAEMQGLQAIRSILSSTPSAAAIPHLLNMMDKASGNDELLAKIQEWVALMEKNR
ncbi:MAG TPA: transcription termination factor Rho [Candidatus Egerieenecus merdigallinarum]|nr:transcription termination factor Rho [Candidatus Egerieenecus merdigallinarum]